MGESLMGFRIYAVKLLGTFCPNSSAPLAAKHYVVCENTFGARMIRTLDLYHHAKYDGAASPLGGGGARKSSVFVLFVRHAF